jgi:hypothetical protein
MRFALRKEEMISVSQRPQESVETVCSLPPAESEWTGNSVVLRLDASSTSI